MFTLEPQPEKPKRQPVKETSRAKCHRCKKPIERGQKSVATGGGPMHTACQIEHAKMVSEYIAGEVAAGRHSWKPVPEPETAFERATRISEGFKYSKGA